jgi:RHS repeat-associated protein
MKYIFVCLILAGCIIFKSEGQSCATCGGQSSASSLGNQTSPSLNISLGTMQYGKPAGTLSFSSSLPDARWFTPAALELDTPFNDLITVITNDDYSLRQINVAQALVDIPIPTTTNGYAINFYYTTQIVGMVSNIYQVTGEPFVTWVITNCNPDSLNQIQVSEYSSSGLIKQWNYIYSNNPESWTVQSLGGIQKVMSVTNLSSSVYQIKNTLLYDGKAVAQQVLKTYQTFSWGTAPIQTVTGISVDSETNTYTYYDPPPFTNGYIKPIKTLINADGSWVYYANYDTNGNPSNVFSSYGDITLANYSNAKETVYTYDPVAAGVSGSGDSGLCNSITARRTVGYIQGKEVERSYTVFPAANERLDILCTTSNAAWNAVGNLITTNYLYTNGPNKNALQSIIKPDGTMTAYYYFTNAQYRTNITVTGQPDTASTHIVDGISNILIINLVGQKVASYSYDVASTLQLSSDVYDNFDNLGRPQQVTHLDGSTEYTTYACCGLDTVIDRDGLATVYLYDDDKRQIGYENIYSGGTSNAISYENDLDAAGRKVRSYRIGTDGSTIIMNQFAYDTAGELTLQTNALNGITTYTRAHDSTTGAWIRAIINPDGGTATNVYYADGLLKKTTGNGTLGVSYGYGYATDTNGNICTCVVKTNLDSNGNLTAEWTKTFFDMIGRSTESLYSDGHCNQTIYNALGQTSKQIDPDGVVTLYAYNSKGELAYTAIDMNRNNVIDFSGTDRINQTTNDVIIDHSTTVRRVRNYKWLDGQTIGTLIASSENSADGLNSWETKYRDSSTPVTTHGQIVLGVSKTMTNTAPDGSYTTSAYLFGRLLSSTRYGSAGNQIIRTSYGYDAYGRQNTVTDARNGTTSFGFNNADLVATNITPNPGGSSPEITVTLYDNMLRPYSLIQPDNTTVSTIYSLNGEIILKRGSRTYPVGYSYDYAGRVKTMTNWTDFNTLAGARVTTWNYDGQRGWLTNKSYADGHGPSYSYTGAGRLVSRMWVRGVTTTYQYDAAGSITNINYSDSTPTIATTYDRFGRKKSTVCNGMTDSITYNLANQLLGETFSGGALSGLSVTNGYDQYLRLINVVGLSSNILDWASYGYDNASRLSSVSDGTNNEVYNYLGNSTLLSQLTFRQGITVRMTTAKNYDFLNRLTRIASSGLSNPVAQVFNYNYNSVNQRTMNTQNDGSYWTYGYDSLGQVVSACKFFPDNTPVAGQQFNYEYDAIGNRTQTKVGGDATGANLRVANYTNNLLNQIISRDVPPYVDVIGASLLTNVLTINGHSAYRNQEYFRQQLPANNSSSALWTNITVSGGQSVTGSIYVARTPEVFNYDADGNLTNDGRWSYVWDGENRLIQMTVNTNVGPQYKLIFVYDEKGRRIQKVAMTNTVVLSTNNFLYDGWNLIAETRPDNSLIRSYVWGTDLSGTSQGSGGVGGLLEISYYGSSTTNSFPAYDGNGNITTLVNAADGTVAANYDYAAFGEPIRITGTMARNNPFRFSTKYADDESDLLYYGYRYYKPSTGTWPNRDPIGEKGGKNIYAFVGNDPIFYVDVFGWGRWNIEIIPSGSSWSVPVITASYFATADDLKKVCCGQTYHVTREAWTLGGIVGTSNDDGGDGGGTIFGPAHSNPDQPGPPIGTGGNGPAIIPHTIHFIWHAICDSNGKELSKTERYYSVWWNGGSWTSPPFQPPQPPNFPFYPYPGAGPL